MKKFYFSLALLAMIMVGCAATEFENMQDTFGKAMEVKGQLHDSVQFYIDKARWGDGNAYLKLATFYHEGKYVKADFLNMMTMARMAREYHGIRRTEDFVNGLPADDDMRILYDSFNPITKSMGEEEILRLTNEVMKRNLPEAEIVYAMIAFKKGDMQKTAEHCDKAIERGSQMGVILKEVLISGGYDGLTPEVFLKIADSFPMAYLLLGNHYANKSYEEDDKIVKAVEFYRKADEHACLDRHGARWLLGVLENSGLVQPIDDLEVHRLKARCTLE